MSAFENLELNLQHFVLFTLILTRVSGLMMTAPIYGTRDVPMQVRGFLSLAVALAIAPMQWHVPPAMPPTLIHYGLLLAAELLVGISLGVGIDILFSGLQLSGQILGQLSGMMMANVFDPNQEENFPVMSRLMYLVAIAVFVCAGGHRAVMAGLLDTFRTIPLGTASIPAEMAWTMEAVLTESFHLALRAAAPLTAALLLATVVVALIGRTVPQLNVMALGFGLNSVVTFAGLAITLGVAAWVFQSHVARALEMLLEAVHAGRS